MPQPVAQQGASTSTRCPPVAASRKCNSRRLRCRAQVDEYQEPPPLQPVEAVRSARLIFDDEGKPEVEYLACWKGDGACTWEPSDNLSEDLVRDFEESFWAAVKKGDLDFVSAALEHGADVMAGLVDADSRSALHFAAALNNKALVQKLLAAGADVNAADREGYTPLHMAAGYLHFEAVEALLEGGADPTCRDRTGRDVPGLVASLREKMPSAAFMTQRLRLEQVARAMTQYAFEDVPPRAVLASRVTDDGDTQYLVQWADGADDAWVPEEMLSAEVLSDYNESLEYAEPEALLGVEQVGDEREYLVRWRDAHAYPDSWEHEDSLPAALIARYHTSQAEADGGTPAPLPQPAREAMAPA